MSKLAFSLAILAISIIVEIQAQHSERGHAVFTNTIVKDPAHRTYPRGFLKEAGDCTCQFVQVSDEQYGCIITDPPGYGFKCRCLLSAQTSRCDSKATPCSPVRLCPPDCATKECCQYGGGNCDGYPNQRLSQYYMQRRHNSLNEADDFSDSSSDSSGSSSDSSSSEEIW